MKPKRKPRPKTTAANLEARFNAGKDVDDYFDTARARRINWAKQGRNPGKPRVGWRLTVPPSGPVKLPRAVLEAAQAWEGDVLAVTVRQLPAHREIVLRILPHGLTPAQLARAERRIVREFKRDRKAGRLVPFTRGALTGRGKA